MIVSHFSYFIILLLGGGDVIESLGGHKTPVLKVVLCTCFTDPRFIAFIHFGPIYMFVRFAVHLYICYFVKVSNQISKIYSNIQYFIIYKMHYPKYEMYEAKDILHISQETTSGQELKLPIFKTSDKYNNKKHQQNTDTRM